MADISDLKANNGYIVWQNTLAKDGQPERNLSSIRLNPENGDLQVDVGYSDESLIQFVDYLSSLKVERKFFELEPTAVKNLRHNLYNFAKKKFGLPEGDEITNETFSTMAVFLERWAKGKENEPPKLRAAAAFLLGTLPHASATLVSQYKIFTDNSFRDSDIEKTEDPEHESLQEKSRRLLSEIRTEITQRQKAESELRDWEAKFGLKNNNDAAFSITVLKEVPHATYDAYAEILDVTLVAGDNPFKIDPAIRVTTDPQWEKQLTAAYVIEHPYVAGLNTIPAIIRTIDGNEDNTITKEDLEKTEALFRSRATLEGANPVERALYAQALLSLPSTLGFMREHGKSEIKELADIYTNEKSEPNNKGKALIAEGEAILAKLLEEEKMRVEAGTPSKIENTPPDLLRKLLAKQAKQSAAAPSSPATNTPNIDPQKSATDSGRKETTPAAKKPAAATGNALPFDPKIQAIQAVMKLLDNKFQEIIWVDGKKGPVTAPRIDVYLDTLKKDNALLAKYPDLAKVQTTDQLYLTLMRLIKEDREFRNLLTAKAATVIDPILDARAHPQQADPKAAEHALTEDVKAAQVLSNILADGKFITLKGDKPLVVDGRVGGANSNTMTAHAALKDLYKKEHIEPTVVTEPEIRLPQSATENEERQRAELDAANTARENAEQRAREAETARAAAEAETARMTRERSLIMGPDFEAATSSAGPDTWLAAQKDGKLFDETKGHSKENIALAKQYCTLFVNSKPTDADLRRGMLHFDETTGKLIFMRLSKEVSKGTDGKPLTCDGKPMHDVLAYDVTKDIDKLAGIESLRLVHATESLMGDAFIASQVANGRLNKGFDMKTGVIVTREGDLSRFGLDRLAKDKKFFLHIADSDGDGVLEAKLVTKDGYEANKALYDRAASQTWNDINNKKFHLSHINNESYIQQDWQDVKKEWAQMVIELTGKNLGVPASQSSVGGPAPQPDPATPGATAR